MNGKNLAYLLLYVDDIILTGSSKALLDQVTGCLKKEFPMSDMGHLTFFLGIKAENNQAGILMSQQHYAKEIIDRACMRDSKHVSTPVDINSKLSAEGSDQIDNPTEYRSLAGALQYLMVTRPDIT